MNQGAQEGLQGLSNAAQKAFDQGYRISSWPNSEPERYMLVRGERHIRSWEVASTVGYSARLKAELERDGLVPDPDTPVESLVQELAGLTRQERNGRPEPAHDYLLKTV